MPKNEFAADTVSVPLIDAGRIVNSGMRTSVNPATLTDGEFANLENIRFASGTLKLRNGFKRVGSTPQANPSDSCLAVWSGTCNGVSYVLSAWDDDSVAYLYSYNASTGAWTEISAASGAFGNTRMTNSGPWSFSVARNPWTGRETIVIQNSFNAPRIYDPGQVGGPTQKLAIHDPIQVPGGDSAFVSAPYFPRFFNLQSGATGSASGANLSISAVNASPDRHYEITRNTTAETNPTVTLQNGASIDLSSCRQLILFAESTTRTWALNVKIEILNASGTSSTIWDPQGTTPYGIAQVPNDSASQRFWVAFSLDAVPAADRASINRIRITWTGATPSSTNTIKLFMVAGSGSILGQSYHCLSYGNQTSGAESRGLYVTQVQPKSLSAHGGPVLNQTAIVNSPLLYYSYDVKALNTSAAERDKGVDSLLVYRNDYGDPDGEYAFVERHELAAYSSGWSFATGSAQSAFVIADETLAEEKLLDISAPDPYSLPLPIGRCMLSANGRLFVGSVQGSSLTQPQSSLVWVSDARHPFRFRPTANSEESGTRLAFESEYPTALAFSSSSAYGENTIWLVTTRRIYRMAGYTTTQLSYLRLAAPHGGYHSGGIQEYGGSLYVFTTENKVLRVSAGALEFLSDMAIEDRLRPVYTAYWNVSSAFLDGRLYLAVDSAGTASATSKRLFVYETRRNETGQEFGWSEDVLASSLKPNYLVNHQGQPFAVLSDKTLAQLDAGGQVDDSGADFSGVIESREWHLPQRVGFTVRSARLVANQDASGAADLTVTYRPSARTQAAQAALTAAQSQARIESSVFSGSGTGPFEGIGARLRAEFNLPGGSEIFALEAVCGVSDLPAETL